MANTYTDLLKLRMPALGDVGWDDEVNDNTKIQEFAFGSVLKSNVVIDGLVPTDGGGLDIDTTAGNVVVGGASFAVAADSVTCTSGVLNWVYVDDAGALQVATSQPTGDYVAIALVDAGSTTITRFGDARNHAEGALTIGVTHTPENYAEDTTKTGAINQHIAGLDTQIGLMYANPNRLINGDMVIAQRGNTFVSPTNGQHNIDCWAVRSNDPTAQATVTRETSGGPTDNLPNWLKASCTTAVSSPATSDVFMIGQRIEGYFIHDLFGQNITLSFWVRSSVTGNLSVSFRNGSADRSYATVFTIDTADTWEFKKITIAMDTLVSAYALTNTTGLRAEFALHAGASRLISANDVWLSENSEAAIGGQNLLGTVGNVFGLTGVKLEVGNVVTPWHPRPLTQELILCKRYFEKSFPFYTAPADNVHEGRYRAPTTAYGSTTAQAVEAFKVEKRATPGSFKFYAPGSLTGWSAGNWMVYLPGTWYSTDSTTLSRADNVAFRVNTPKTGSYASGHAYLLSGHWTAAAPL